MRSRIVLTRPDGCVSVVCPSINAITWMSCGGRWPDKPRGWLDEQIERHITAGHGADVSAKYVRAMQFGGCTSHEALAIIRDRDCAHRGTGIELWDIDDVPKDRWFRSAWRRSHNGGPIAIDLKKAKPIQFRHIKTAIELENKRRENELERFDDLLEINLVPLRDKIHGARDETDLRRIWPEEIDVL